MKSIKSAAFLWSQDSQPTVSFAVMVVFYLCLFLCSPRHKQQIRPNNSRSLLCHDCDTNQQPWEPLTQFQHQILLTGETLTTERGWVEEMAKNHEEKKKEIEMSPANISEINMEMSSTEKVCSELRPTAPVCVSVYLCVFVAQWAQLPEANRRVSQEARAMKGGFMAKDHIKRTCKQWRARFQSGLHGDELKINLSSSIPASFTQRWQFMRQPENFHIKRDCWKRTAN